MLGFFLFVAILFSRFVETRLALSQAEESQCRGKKRYRTDPGKVKTAFSGHEQSSKKQKVKRKA